MQLFLRQKRFAVMQIKGRRQRWLLQRKRQQRGRTARQIWPQCTEEQPITVIKEWD